MSLSDIPDLNGGDWLGFLRFDFGGFPITNQYYYYMDIESQHYTRNGSTFYVAALCDYAVPLSNLVSANDTGLHMSLVGDEL